LLSSISARPEVTVASSVIKVADAEVVATPIIVCCAKEGIVLATAQDEGLLCKVGTWLVWGTTNADVDARLATHAMLAERERVMMVFVSSKGVDTAENPNLSLGTLKNESVMVGINLAPEQMAAALVPKLAWREQIEDGLDRLEREAKNEAAPSQEQKR